MTGSDAGAGARLDAVVHGRVQGVGFRVFVARRAIALGLVGWVENRSGGTVAVRAEGPEAALDALLAAITDGPPGARVERVDASRGPAGGSLRGFDIRSRWHGGD